MKAVKSAESQRKMFVYLNWIIFHLSFKLKISFLML